MPARILSLLVLLFIILTFSAGCDKPIKTSGGVSSWISAAEVQNRISEKTGVAIDTVVDVFDLPDIKSSRITQLLFNQAAEIEEQKDGWSRITADGFNGWIRSNLITRDCTSINSDRYKYEIVITGKSKKVSSHPGGGITIKDVAMGTILFSRGRVDNNYEVALPGGITGWVSESGTIRLSAKEDIPLTSSADFISTAIKYKGTSYLSGGISSWGMDESGLVYTCAYVNGIKVPRELKEQFKAGTEINVKAVTPGDLLFFGRLGDLNDINNVGIYLGDNKLLYASSTKGYVAVGSLDDDHFRERLAGARRIFQY